ncbi:hypothetical protein DFJ58DRAFT_734090 [Suillus subalutaceus]|uniref:uncharacterized protein n=1 Tax=Suillus subalutaceus TaxID=48586 RepID=UPI001B86207D|nr:uncharacterized protein DFJ58DRAFT_734090 [Suillus subalutaceus]KAG1837903.1 hypothetical protein DFJ58DRAFT_734090 [Suillus subalutaceus]
MSRGMDWEYGGMDEGMEVQIAAFEEVSRWFEPLLLHYHTLHRHSHPMDDKTEVMFTNLHNDPEGVFTCLWALHTMMVLRLQNKLTTTVACSQQSQPLKDRKEVNENFERLGSASKNDLKMLWNMMALRKGRGMDPTTEPQVICGILALHVMSWDWNNCMSKNSKRDMELFIKAILLDLGRECTRREDLFNDLLVAGLRKILEDVIAKHAKAINMIGEGGRMIKRKRWSWYNGAEIPSDIAPTTTVTLTDAHIQHRHELEGYDRAAIIKLISYVKHIAGVKATSSTHSPMAVNIVRGLQNLIHELEINSTCLRIQALEGDNSVLYNIKDTVDLMIPAIKGIEDQNTIDEQEDEQALPCTSMVPVRPHQRPIVHPELSDLSIDDPTPTSHTSTTDTIRTLQTENEGNARASTGTEDPIGEQGDGDGWSDRMVTDAAVSSEPNSGAEDSGHGYNATAAVVSCEGTPINIDQRHASSGMEDLGTSVGDLGVDTTGTTTGAHMIKVTVPSIHNGSLTTLVPKTSRAEVPSKQLAPKSMTHVTVSKISKHPRGSTVNSPGHANKKAHRTYTNGNDLDSDDFVVVKATIPMSDDAPTPSGRLPDAHTDLHTLIHDSIPLSMPLVLQSTIGFGSIHLHTFIYPYLWTSAAKPVSSTLSPIRSELIPSWTLPSLDYWSIFMIIS